MDQGLINLRRKSTGSSVALRLIWIATGGRDILLEGMDTRQEKDESLRSHTTLSQVQLTYDSIMN